MPDVCSASPATAYLTKANIITPNTANKTTDEAAARVEIATRLGVSTVTGGSIQTGN